MTAKHNINIMESGLKMQSACINNLITTLEPTLSGDGLNLPVSIDVYGVWQPGFPGDREQPKEKAGYDVHYLVLNNGEDKIKITSGVIFDRVSDVINEVKR